MTDIADLSDISVLAEVTWPGPGDENPPQLPGFVLSEFSPLVAEVARRCLTVRHGSAPAPAELGERTAVVLVSASGDLVSATHVAHAVDTGGRVGPLLFFQSVPNSVAGHVAAEWGLGGPVVCLSPPGDPRACGLDEARLLIEDGAADEVLVVMVEQAEAMSGRSDRAVAVLASKGVSR